MLRRLSHVNGVTDEAEILFSTPFGYFFPEAAKSKPCLLPRSLDTVRALKTLGDAMATPGDSLAEPLNTAHTPAIFTYLGQFIDHDITARTDREGSVTSIGNGEEPVPVDPDIVVATLRNGRRPQLDLDSLFGDGPSLVRGGAVSSRTQSDALYKGDYDMKHYDNGVRRDLPRGNDCVALIADMRNDENLNVSQLHGAFLAFYNAVKAAQPSGNNARRYVRARQLVRWAYQYVVVHDYLHTVCDKEVVADTLANGPRAYGASAGKADAFMPIEFSVAAFRFGHSMIRPQYQLNEMTGPLDIMQLLGPSGPANKALFFDPAGADPHQIKADAVIDFNFYARGGSQVQFARKFDTRIAHGLAMLPLGGRDTDPVLSHLARSNLLRGYSLSVPTGQAMCDAMGMDFLSPTEILAGEEPGIADAVQAGFFHHRTPLWYYVLREAAVQQNGERLGALGSRMVAEAIIGMLKGDPNSYLNNQHDPAVQDDGVEVIPGSGKRVNSLSDILRTAGVF